MTTSFGSAATPSSVAVGPAGRAMAQPMEVGLAIWFAEGQLAGFAGYLKQESLAEQAHAARWPTT
jgi:hypothetical protein